MRRRTLMSLVVLAVVLVSLTFWRKQTGQQEPISSPVPAPPPGSPEQQMVALQSAAPPAAPRTRERPHVPLPVTRERQEFRQRVAEAVRTREQLRAAQGAGAAAPAAAAPEPREGTMKDKTGRMGEEVKIFNRQFLPLVDECYEQAHERDPELRGMLAVDVAFASAEGVGGIIETLEPAPGNQVDDAELIDCVRQSAFTVELPMPTQDGREGAMLTIPLGIDSSGEPVPDKPPAH